MIMNCLDDDDIINRDVPGKGDIHTPTNNRKLKKHDLKNMIVKS